MITKDPFLLSINFSRNRFNRYADMFGLLFTCLSLLTLISCDMLDNTIDDKPTKSSDPEKEMVVDSVSVNLSDTSGGAIKHVAMGFLHGIKAVQPPDSLVLPLNIRWSRDWMKNYEERTPRIKELGITDEISLADTWGYGNVENPPGKDGDWSEWESFIKNEVARAESILPSEDLQFDIWNEADGSTFWKYDGQYGFPSHFFETWKHAYHAIRSEDPNAVIVGPSYSHFVAKQMEKFLDYAKANNVVPDYLSWHFNVNIVEQRNTITNYMKNHNIHVNGIEINEYNDPTVLHAGHTAFQIAQLERAKVHAGMHAIFTDDLASLSGILTPNTHQKKATWWDYKIYADMSGKILTTIPGEIVDLIAELNTNTIPKTVSILLGARGRDTLHEDNYVKINFNNVSSVFTGKKVNVTLKRIPNNNGEAVGSLEKVYSKEISILKNNKFEILIPWDTEKNAYMLQLTGK